VFSEGTNSVLLRPSFPCPNSLVPTWLRVFVPVTNEAGKTRGMGTREWGQGVRFGKRCESGVKVPQIRQRELPEFKVKAMNGKV